MLNGKIDDEGRQRERKKERGRGEKWERQAGGGRTMFPRCLPPEAGI